MDNGINNLIGYIIGLIVVNLILVLLGKFFGHKQEIKNADGQTAAYRRRSMVLALGCYLLLAVIDIAFISWLLSLGSDQVFGVDNFLNNVFE